MRRLTILSGQAKGAVYDLTGAQIEVGRADENTIVLEDNDVSRRHAVLTRDGDEHKVRDLGTINGTWVNGQQIKEARLKPNDILQFGLVETRYEAAPAGVPIAIGSAPVNVVRKSAADEQLAGLTTLNRELNLQLLNARQELSKVQQTAPGANPAEVDRLQRDLTAARGEVERARASVARVEELTQRNAELTAQLTHKDMELSRVKAEADARLERELKVVNEELTRARGEVENVRRESEERVRRELTERRRIESELTRAQGERDQATRELVETKSRLLEVTGQLDTVRAELEQARGPTGNVTTLTESRRALERELDILRAKAAGERQQLTAQHQAEVARMQAELAAARADIEQQAKKETAKITVIAGNAANATELTRVRGELEQTRAQLEAARQNTERMERLVGQNRELAEKLTATQREIAELRQRGAGGGSDEEVGKLKGELAVARAELFRLGTRAAKVAPPAPAPATPTVAPAPTALAEPALADVGPPPGRWQKAAVGGVVLAVVAGLVWQLFRGEDSILEPAEARRPLVENRVIVDDPFAPPPRELLPAAPARPPDSVASPVDPPPVTPDILEPVEPPAPAAVPTLDEPPLPAAAVSLYRDPHGRFVCPAPTGWQARAEAAGAESRVRFVSGKDELAIMVHGADWPELKVRDQAQLVESMITQFRLRHPRAYAEPQGTEWQLMEGALALQLDLSVTQDGERLWVRVVEFRRHGRSATIELIVRTLPQQQLLAMIFDAFLVNFEILPVE